MNNSNSSSGQPDLDWSQVRETVKLLTVSATQVRSSVLDGEESVTRLAESFASMVDHLSGINQVLSGMEESPEKDKIMLHYQHTNDEVQSSIVAFQFYDRMQQCLQHVTENLLGLSEIVDNPQLLYNPMEWQKLQDEIRVGYTMESEKIMFDAILQGKSVEEAIILASQCENSEDKGGDEIELF